MAGYRSVRALLHEGLPREQQHSHFARGQADLSGQWTYIRTIPATNLTEPTTGWIETNRLYEVDSLMPPNPIKNPLEHPPVVPRPGTVVRPDILTWLAM